MWQPVDLTDCSTLPSTPMVDSQPNPKKHRFSGETVDLCPDRRYYLLMTFSTHTSPDSGVPGAESALAGLLDGAPWGREIPAGEREALSIIAEVMAGGLDPLTGAVRALRAVGVPVDAWGGLAPWSAGGMVLVADAVNCAAKQITAAFYAIKPAVWEAVGEIPGVASGWETDDSGRPAPGEEGGCFFLSHADAGVTCAHDPQGQIGGGLDSTGRPVAWPHRWSGIYRQDQALLILGDPALRRRMAIRTSARLAPLREKMTV